VWLLVMRCDRVSAPPVADKGRNSNSGRDVSLACVDGCSELGGSERTIGGCLHPDPLTSMDRGTLTLLFLDGTLTLLPDGQARLAFSSILLPILLPLLHCCVHGGNLLIFRSIPLLYLSISK
jgi:hypothetical protein